jgi:hypothetical protein
MIDTCPIDDTRLVSLKGYEEERYICTRCHAKYTPGGDVNKEAREHSQKIIEYLVNGRIFRNISNYESVVSTAISRGIIEIPA